MAALRIPCSFPGCKSTFVGYKTSLNHFMKKHESEDVAIPAPLVEAARHEIEEKRNNKECRPRASQLGYWKVADHELNYILNATEISRQDEVRLSKIRRAYEDGTAAGIIQPCDQLLRHKKIEAIRHAVRCHVSMSPRRQAARNGAIAKAKAAAKAKAFPKAKAVAKAKGAPKAKAVAKAKGVPKAKAVAKAKGAPKAKAVAKANGIPKAKAVAKAKGVPKAKALAPGSPKSPMKKVKTEPPETPKRSPGQKRLPSSVVENWKRYKSSGKHIID